MLTLLVTPTETATGRSQYNFPGAPLGPPSGRRHGAHASISGPISAPPNTSSFPSSYRNGPPPSTGTPLGGIGRTGPGAPRAIPPFNGTPPPNSPLTDAETTTQPPGERTTSPPAFTGAAAPARGRRQYAAGTAAYIAGEQATGPGHGHSQSQQFFSPATGIPPLAGAPDGNNNGFFSPAGPDFGIQQNVTGGGAGGYANQGPPPTYGQPPVAGLTNQFGQMGMGGGHKTLSPLSTTNLVGLPLNPAELFSAPPPEIRLPPNVRFTFS